MKNLHIYFQWYKRGFIHSPINDFWVSLSCLSFNSQESSWILKSKKREKQFCLSCCGCQDSSEQEYFTLKLELFNAICTYPKTEVGDTLQVITCSKKY